MWAFNRVNMMGGKYTLIQYNDEQTEIQSKNHDDSFNKSIVVNHNIHKLSQSWYDWSKGGQLIQYAFPYLSPDEREFIMTGITAEEWDKIFPDNDSDQVEGEDN